MDNHDEFYNTVCKPQFQSIHNKLDSIYSCLKGKDIEPGLVEQVRNNTKFRKGICWAAIVAIGALITQIMVWLRTKIGV